MKQDTVVSTLILITGLYIVVSLSLMQSLIALAGGAIAYQITNSMVVVLIVLVSIPVIVELNKRNLFRMREGFKADEAASGPNIPRQPQKAPGGKDTKEGFHTDGAVTISNRVKGIQKSIGGKNVGRLSDRLPSGLKGVVESPEIESFQTMDASGQEFEPEETNAPGFSVPAFVKEKGRLLVVPEMSVPRSASEDMMPKPNPLMEKPDDEGLETALAPDATKLPIDENQQAANLTSMSVGPSSTA